MNQEKNQPIKNILCTAPPTTWGSTHLTMVYWMNLVENMVFTVEPGIYLPEEGFGVRLEDDVVVQNSGEPINLMKDIPIEIEEIEELMNN